MMECEESAEAEIAGFRLRLFPRETINVQMYQCTDVPMRETINVSASADADVLIKQPKPRREMQREQPTEGTEGFIITLKYIY